MEGGATVKVTPSTHPEYQPTATLPSLKYRLQRYQQQAPPPENRPHQPSVLRLYGGDHQPEQQNNPRNDQEHPPCFRARDQDDEQGQNQRTGNTVTLRLLLLSVPVTLPLFGITAMQVIHVVTVPGLSFLPISPVQFGQFLGVHFPLPAICTTLSATTLPSRKSDHASI
jgi:hypothetical protein